MTKQTVVYYWNKSTTGNGWYYIEVDYDNKLYRKGDITTNEGFSSNRYMHSVPRYKDIKLHEKVLKNVGFNQVESFRRS